MRRNKKGSDVKAMRAAAREQVPMSVLGGRVVPMKRKAILNKVAAREAKREMREA